MQSVLIVIHLMTVIALVAVVLLQRSEGGAIGIGGGGGFMSGRGQANAFTRATAILAAMFFATSIGLTILARLNQGSEVIDQTITPIEPNSGGAAKEGGKGSLLEQLQQLEGQSTKPALPPSVLLPGEGTPAGPSVLEVEPDAAKNPKLPLPALPAAPLIPVPQPVAPQAGQSVLQTGPTEPHGQNLPPLPKPAAPQPGQSVLQTGPPEPQGLNLPLLPQQPATPLPQSAVAPAPPARVDPGAASPANHHHPAKARTRQRSR